MLNDSTINATVGAGSTGAVAIANPNGSATVGGFVYIQSALPPLVLTSFSPDSAGPGSTITITGHYLSDASVISFGGTLVQSIRVFSDSVLYVTLGQGATGTLVVSSANGLGLAARFYLYLHRLPTPTVTITGFSPTTGTSRDTVSIRRHEANRRQIG